MNTGDKLRFRNIDKWKPSNGNNCVLNISKSAKIYGKLAESLTSEFKLSRQYNFNCMFGGSTGLIDASEFDLYDGIVLTNSCYYSMFLNCTSLSSAPKLPATTLAEQCYANMFEGCTSLVNAPKLPATMLAYMCYSNMFEGCTSLTTQDINLPATTLKSYCYDDMFINCGITNTKTIHVPASLASTVTASMFGDNSGVTVAYSL